MELFYIILIILVIGSFIYGSVIFDERWRKKYPEEKSFRWGYFQALSFFPGGLLGLAAFIYSVDFSQMLSLIGLFSVSYAAIASWAGYVLITQKKKWAWVLMVLLQFNMGTWLIDLVYGGNRRHEFRPDLPNTTAKSP
jgi:hypothetical protein